MYTNWNLPENEDRIRQAAAESFSIAEMCRKLNLVAKGGNIATMKRQIARLNIDVSHHTGQAWHKDKYLEPNSSRHKQTLKQYLIREYGHHCWNCGLSEWMGKPISLEMDHIDGNNANNDLSNLRILCPNCHSQTPTFRNNKRDGEQYVKYYCECGNEEQKRSKRCVECYKANRKACSKKSTVVEHEHKEPYCECGNKKTKGAKHCIECYNKNRHNYSEKTSQQHPQKIDWPDTDMLLDMVDRLGYSAAGRELGVSDNAVRKHLKYALMV